MARKRKYELEKQTHFARMHSELLKGIYMTDVDSLQIINTENTLYEEYDYIKRGNKTFPNVRRIIEVKSRMSKYLEGMFAGSIEPSQGVIAQAYFIAQANAFRREHKMTEAVYWFVVEDFGEYPYEIWNVTTTFGTGKIQFNQIGTVMDNDQFTAFFHPR